MKKLLRKISMVACSLVLSITMVAATSSSSLALQYVQGGVRGL